MEYNSLKTGETYRLQDLFSKDNKIIIPDLQRDYCWGTTQNPDGENLVRAFLSNLMENMDEDLNLGLLYGYEAPLGHIQLCDGQQRITTLFLLLGMLNKRTNGSVRRYLISDTEENDDWEPYLQYAIRESSLYFLSDLTRYFFIKDYELEVSALKQQSWYFKDYDLDPSIQSMIAAMEIIEKEISDIDCFDFEKFVLEKLSFLYYDMGDRTKGEETFVVINTTGEPLSATENLKPLLLSRQSHEKIDMCAEAWEIWEKFFWENRNNNDTSDNGLKEFFRWIMLLSLDPHDEEFKKIQKDGTYKFDLNISFDTINRYFEIVSKRLFSDVNALFENNKEWLSPDINGNTQNVWFKVLPVIQYIYRFPDAEYNDVWRVRMFFWNLEKISNVQKAINDVLPEAIRIIEELPDKDICSVLQIENVSKTLLSDEVKLKLQILSGNNQREAIEKAFWKEEEHIIWSGEIMPMIQWSTIENVFDFELFKSYSEKFTKVFHDNLRYTELDITRRALLTRELKDYPRIFKGYTNWSFAYDCIDWHTLIFDNVNQFKVFFDKLDINDIYRAQFEMIKNNPESNNYDEFVKIPDLLAYCDQKKIQWWGDDMGWVLIKRDRAYEYANLKSYRLYLELKECIIKHDVRFCGEEGSYAVIDETDKHNTWEIHIWYSGGEKYALQLFIKDGKTENSFGDLPQIFGLTWNGDRYEKLGFSKSEILEITQGIVNRLNQ